MQRCDTEKTIHDFIDLRGLRQFLVHYPNMLLIFEVLINHIQDYITLKKIADMILDTTESSHI